MADKTSVASQRSLAIGTVLLAGLAWSLSFDRDSERAIAARPSTQELGP